MKKQSTAAELRLQAEQLERREREQTRSIRSERLMNSFSKWIMAGVMLMFFVGVAVAAYAVLTLGASLALLLDYIRDLARIAFLGYFVKAFGENIAKIILPFLMQTKSTVPANAAQTADTEATETKFDYGGI
jgi:hypothetical protein